jgi:hypothetical protein
MGKAGYRKAAKSVAEPVVIAALRRAQRGVAVLQAIPRLWQLLLDLATLFRA